MKYILCFFAVICGFSSEGQERDYNINLYTHPGVNPNIQYAEPIQTTPPPVVIVEHNRSRRRSATTTAPRSNSAAGIKYTMHDKEGHIFYLQVNQERGDVEVSTPTGKIVEYVVSVSRKRWDMVDSSHVMHAYYTKSGSKYKLYNAYGKFITKTANPLNYPAWTW